LSTSSWSSPHWFSRHLLKLREAPAALKLTRILEYFANVVGERVNTVRFGNLTASDYLLNSNRFLLEAINGILVFNTCPRIVH